MAPGECNAPAAGQIHGGKALATGWNGIRRSLASRRSARNRQGDRQRAFRRTLRDYGRFGLLMVNGNANGHRVVSAEWIKSATVPSRPPLQFGKLYENYPLGYGYGWWLFENGRYEAVGMFGQFVYIAPKENVVIVKL